MFVTYTTDVDMSHLEFAEFGRSLGISEGTPLMDFIKEQQDIQCSERLKCRKEEKERDNRKATAKQERILLEKKLEEIKAAAFKAEERCLLVAKV